MYVICIDVGVGFSGRLSSFLTECFVLSADEHPHSRTQDPTPSSPPKAHLLPAYPRTSAPHPSRRTPLLGLTDRLLPRLLVNGIWISKPSPDSVSPRRLSVPAGRPHRSTFYPFSSSGARRWLLVLSKYRSLMAGAMVERWLVCLG